MWKETKEKFILENVAQTLSTLCSVEVKGLVAQSCQILCNPVDTSPPDSFVHGIPQARILGSVVISPGDLSDQGIFLGG